MHPNKKLPLLVVHKYIFMFLFNSSCKQVTLSMKTALVTHPRLMLHEKSDLWHGQGKVQA